MKKAMQAICDPNELPVRKAEVVLFDRDGNAGDTKEPFAKTEVYENKDYHYVLRDGFHLVNPLDGTFNQRNRHKWSMSMVSEECFNSYLNFLKTKKNVCMTNAERLSHGGR